MTVTEAAPTTGTPITRMADVPLGTRLIYLGGSHDPTIQAHADKAGFIWRGADEGTMHWSLVYGCETYPAERPPHGRQHDQGHWYVSNDDASHFAIATPDTPGVPWRVADQPSGTEVRFTGTPEDCRGIWRITRANTAEVLADMVTAENGRTGALPRSYGFWPNRGDRGTFRMEDFAEVGATPADDENDVGSGSVNITTENVEQIPPGTRLVWCGEPTDRWATRTPWMGYHDTDGTSMVLYGDEYPGTEDGHCDTGTWYWYDNVDNDDGNDNICNDFRLAEPLVVVPVVPVVLANHTTQEFGDPAVIVHQYLRDPEDAEVELAYALNDAATARAEVNDIRMARDVARRDLQSFKQTVFDHVTETAVEKDWCVEGTNRHLSAIGLWEWDGPERDFEVTVTCQYTTTVTVTASDEDAASEMVADDIDTYVSPPSYERWTNCDVDEVCEA